MCVIFYKTYHIIQMIHIVSYYIILPYINLHSVASYRVTTSHNLISHIPYHITLYHIISDLIRYIM